MYGWCVPSPTVTQIKDAHAFNCSQPFKLICFDKFSALLFNSIKLWCWFIFDSVCECFFLSFCAQPIKFHSPFFLKMLVFSSTLCKKERKKTATSLGHGAKHEVFARLIVQKNQSTQSEWKWNEIGQKQKSLFVFNSLFFRLSFRSLSPLISSILATAKKVFTNLLFFSPLSFFIRCWFWMKCSRIYCWNEISFVSSMRIKWINKFWRQQLWFAWS